MILVAGASAIVAMTVNRYRADGLPHVMPFPPEYQCPALAGPGKAVELKTALEVYGRADIVFIDARERPSFEKGRIAGARSIPYSFLEPIPPAEIKNLRPFETVIVYCNTPDAERSKAMAGELVAAGVEGATYLEGGLLKWARAGGAVEGQAPQEYEKLLE